MGSMIHMSSLLFGLLLVVFLFQGSVRARKLAALVEPQPTTLAYHKGRLLTGPISINLVWYGKFTPAQRAIVADFVSSLSSSVHKQLPAAAGVQQEPSVASWWKIVQSYYAQSNSPVPLPSLGKQVLDESYSLGRSLTSDQLLAVAAPGGQQRALNVVLTAEDVAVEGFCMSRCGTHSASLQSKVDRRFPYVWVGNSASQCPGQCAWPFHQPLYGPQNPPLVAPNGDVGVDGIVINLASMLAGTFTNPFGDGFFQGPREAPLEAASACPGVYGKNAYPGYPGDLLVDPATGASYNVNGVDGRKYLLPALVDPATSSCTPLV